jgi:hypothetical protein
MSEVPDTNLGLVLWRGISEALASSFSCVEEGNTPSQVCVVRVGNDDAE